MSEKITMIDQIVQTDFSDLESNASSSDTSSFSGSENCFMDTLSSDDMADIQHTIYEAVDEYMESNILNMKLPDFHTILIDDVSHIVFQHLLDAEICSDDDYEEIREQVETLHEHYFEIAEIPPRSIHHEMDFDAVPDDELREQVKQLKLAEQSIQKSQEWYETRHRMLTASNLWKVFSTEAQFNSLVYEKCAPANIIPEGAYVNTESTLHWGNKYEPLTTMVYEKKQNTQVESLGCLTHPKYPYLGASPDGIVVSDNRFGRLIEIKNIVNRDIDVPSEAYWIQMQIQMEVCDLDVCDFIETRFKEYASEEEFWQDDEPNKEKGVILMFLEKTLTKKNYTPNYVYMPLDIEIDAETVANWINATISTKDAENYTIYKRIFWHLDEYSCVVVKRNRQWFSAAQPKIEAAWNTIQKERIEGYSHRMAKKKTKPSTNNNGNIVNIFTVVKMDQERNQEQTEQNQDQTQTEQNQNQTQTEQNQNQTQTQIQNDINESVQTI